MLQSPLELGYEAALDLGVWSLENGRSDAAVEYLRRAADLRPTRYALVMLAKCHRDLGAPELAKVALVEAKESYGNDGHVLVSLAACLCDLGDIAGATDSAQAAIRLDGESPAAHKIMARILREGVASIRATAEANSAHVTTVLARADAFDKRAAELEPNGPPDGLEERRQRRAVQHTVQLPRSPLVMGIDQTRGEVTVSTPVESIDSQPAFSPGGGDSDSGTSWLTRGWQRLRSFFP